MKSERYLGDGKGDTTATVSPDVGLVDRQLQSLVKITDRIMMQGSKLDIGCGDEPTEGYIGVDRKRGDEAYPLSIHGMLVPSDTCDEIRASHVLEHFSHRETLAVLKEWVRALKPGGVLKIAVPNFDYIVAAYQSEKSSQIPIAGYLMGGHTDDNDHHGAIFNEEMLKFLMHEAGLGEVQHWKSEQNDCAALPVSLNLMGMKGAREYPSLRGLVAACFSVPRFGPLDTQFVCMDTFTKLEIPAIKKSGAYWGACLQGAMEIQLETGAKYLLTLDYDSLFSVEDVLSLYRLMEKYPEADAIAPIQCGRDRSTPLMTVAGPDGKARGILNPEELQQDLLELRSAHFGLTIIRAESLKKLPKPWFMHTPDPKGQWGDGRIDDDTYFWCKGRENGFRLFQANRIAIGHCQWVASFPDAHLETRHLYVADYLNAGKPAWAWK